MGHDDPHLQQVVQPCAQFAFPFPIVCSRICVCVSIMAEGRRWKEAVSRGVLKIGLVQPLPSVDVALNSLPCHAAFCGLPTHTGHLREPADSGTGHPGPGGNQQGQEHHHCTNTAQLRYSLPGSPLGPFSFGPSAPLKFCDPG